MSECDVASASTPAFDDAETAARFVAEALPHLDQIRRGAYRLTTSKYDAEDLVQETLLKAYSGFHTYQPDTNMRAWLFRIMQNTWTSAYHARQRRPNELLCEGLSDWQLLDERIFTPVGLRAAEIEAMTTSYDDEIIRALKAIPLQNRMAVYFADIEGYQYREIAAMMGTPVGTVMSRLARGRSRLRALLSECRRRTQGGGTEQPT
ncbi:sigma-70 family RNA polymerase sigma factor [Mycobacterium sp. 141]|uniref:sigma-70 family RNA polymerase sigma factor n=1 Tax=Mycobacterium sp. 141 TaxID=1120797 RepID=UPI000568EE25|nr:sigma-70 family RNA polymerase sigma factor [Mycobacterium sp. 141]